MNKADFEYELVNGVLCIIDLNFGNMTVTNDIENVLRQIKHEWPNVYPANVDFVIYRDSDGNWDQILFEKQNGEHKGFKFIGTTKQAEAINFVKNDQYMQIID